MNFRIVVLPGDGVGPEVTAAAMNVVQVAADRFGAAVEFDYGLIGGVAIEETGTPLPEATCNKCRRAHAVLLGAVGGPKWDNPGSALRPEQGLLGLRRELELFANLRPVQTSEYWSESAPVRAELLQGVDLLFVRELTGGIYFGEQRRETIAGGVRATDTCTYTSQEIERVVRVAAGLARQRRSKLTLVDKANVLETSRLWREVAVGIMRADFSDVTFEHLLVDAFAMHLIRNPASFDVIVTENLFGDILTDEAAVLVGSIGVLPSASLGAKRNSAGLPLGLYEPIHGSAPALAGQNVANPVGSILSGALLLRHSLGLEHSAQAVERAVLATLQQGLRTPDLAGGGAACSTSDFGAFVAQHTAQAPLYV